MSGTSPTTVSIIGRTFEEAFEGLILGAYDDADDHVVRPGQLVEGTLTIGYGHTNAAGLPKVYVGMIITSDQADQILSSDLASVEADLAVKIKRPVNQNQFDALASFQFNTGWLDHPQCSLLAAVNAGRDVTAEADFGLYDMASGRVLAGLVRRRKAEALLYAGNVAEALTLAGVSAGVIASLGV